MRSGHGPTGPRGHWGKRCRGQRSCWWRVPASPLLIGVAALLWLLLRSGTRPGRLVYPCQQAAFGAAAAAFGAPLVALVVATRLGVLRLLDTARGRITVALLAAFAVLVALLGRAEQVDLLPLAAPPLDYAPEVFVVNEARGPEDGRHGGVDDLIRLMGTHGFRWHRSSDATVTSGPDGMIGPDDLVLIKVNGQWTERGGTNTDVLRGVIQRIIEHPDGFQGEILVADNGQGRGTLDASRSNAEDPGQSPQAVVEDFRAQAWSVAGVLWDGIRQLAVDEYSTGDMRSGYVVTAQRDPETGIKVSYPKFQTPLGTYISYKHGVWLPESEMYDEERLVVLNLPILKTHFIYGVTASVKNHMGVVTQALGTDSHDAVGRGGMGSLLAEVRMPDLNLLDCTWILARPGSGPSASYEQATREDRLLASTDPVALDAWAAKFVLMPRIVENGYELSQYRGAQDPDNPASVFRRYLDRSMNELLLAGKVVTSDYRAVELHAWPGEEGRHFTRGDANADNRVDVSDAMSTLGCLFLGWECSMCADAADANDDETIDLSDGVYILEWLFTGGVEPPAPGAQACGLDPTPGELDCAIYTPCDR